MPIKRPEMVDEFTRKWIESFGPSERQNQQAARRSAKKQRAAPRFKPANKKSSTATRSALAVTRSLAMPLISGAIKMRGLPALP
jgi:hypothetical protein